MYKFKVIKIKRYILPCIFLLFTISLVLFSSSNLNAAKSGLNLWANSVIPSLFPFFVATELLSQTEIPYILGRLLNNIMRPMFNIGGEGSFGLIMGLISGYPIGAKIAVNFRQNNILPKVECERLLSFTNNSGPLFIIGTVGITMFGNSTIGFLLLITHILACFTVGFLFKFWGNSSSFSKTISHSISSSKHIPFSNLGGVLAEAISSATSTILMIGGFIVLFSVIISILKASKIICLLSNMILPLFYFFNLPTQFITPLILGLLEITNGISLISAIKIKAISLNIILTSFLLGLGGISIFLQVFSITSKSDLSIKPYILGKLLHGIIAAFYTFLFIQFVPFFNFNL